ncbi:LPS-assembly protein LptD [Rhodobacteraceae bacterium CH30]|nr:LPS-assembly protein LptD [Rhodobacteraceae bacterium CH30]
MPAIFRPTPLVAALAALFLAPPALADTLPAGSLTVTADELSGQMDNELKARGNVVAIRDDQTITSDWLNYYVKRNELIEAGDRVHMTQPGSDILSQKLDYSMATQQGSADDAVFAFQQGKGVLRGKSDELKILGDKHYELKRTTVNTCDPGDESWYLKATTVDADYTRNVGVARNARLYLGGVPVLYTPWMDFPLDGGRKSGLLFPTFSVGSAGLDISTPYYWNIAPNYDATLFPRYIAKRGLMLGGEFRYLQPGYQGQMYTEQIEDKETDTHRYLWKGQHRQQISPDLSWGFDGSYVSDNNYFDDFSDRLAQVSSDNLERQAWASYNLGWGAATIRAQRYQTLIDNARGGTIPYARLPQITLNGGQTLPAGLSWNLLSEATRFSHPDLQEGDRLMLNPSLSWRADASWGYIQPKLGVNFRQYALDGWRYGGTPDQQRSRNESITTPTFSVDSGLYFERESEFAGSAHTQTLEPRLYYVNIPYRDQSKLPNFDSSINDFDWTQLFSENRYSGWDRINEANQLTAAVTSSYIDNDSGLERLRVGIGQRVYFSEDRVKLYPGESVRDNVSDILATVGGDLTRNLRLDGAIQYNPEQGRTEKYNVALRYHPEAGKALSLRYRYDPDELVEVNGTAVNYPTRQIELAGQWPITRQLYGVGRLEYSLAAKQAFDTLAGFEYNAGCWTFRMVGQRFVTDIDQFKTSVMFQLELKDMSSFGKVSDTLRLAIPGYSKTNE